MTDQQPHTPPRGIPGKWFVLPFGMVLLFAVWLVVSMAFRFQAIMRQLEATREVWPKAALVIRNHLSDTTHAAQSVAEAGSFDAKAWEDCMARFAKSSMFDEQSIVAKEIFQLVQSDPSRKSSLGTLLTDETLKSVASSELKRAQLQSGIVGWCTLQGLRLKLPPLFVLD
ncbi:MAG: hypothetical protein MUC43_09835 [Pirellula sp.]|nr:hypothetical protein [Pirellula sp.]